MWRKRHWLFPILLAAMHAVAQRYPFLSVPGAPHGIYTMMQDSQSALWLGTIDDVVRFDGEHFYSLRPYGFPKELPNGFAEDSDGGIWIATQGTDVSGGTGRGGLYRYKNGHVEKEFSGDGLAVISIAPDRMLASMGTELNAKAAFGDLVLFRKSPTGWIASPIMQKQADHLSLDHRGNVLFPCPGGWCEIAGQQLRDWQNAASRIDVQRHAGDPLVERVLRDKFGCVWFRSEGSASYQCPADREPITISKQISSTDASAHLEETKDGSIFMLVKMALGRPGVFHVATGTDGLPEPIDTAMVGKDGTIWVGADSGLYRFMYPFRMEYWDKSGGIGTAFSILLKGKDVLATSNGVFRLNQKTQRWDRFPNTMNFYGHSVAGPGDTLFALGLDSVTQFDLRGKIVANGKMPDNHAEDSVIGQTGDGVTWLGRYGIYQIVRDGRRLSFHIEVPVNESIRDMQYDSAHDTLWVCAGNQILFRKGGSWGHITQKDGLPNLQYSAVGFEPKGDIWVGALSKFITWIHNPASGHPIVRNYTQWLNEFAASAGTTFIAGDSGDRLWWSRDELYMATPSAAREGNWVRLDHSDWSGSRTGPQDRYSFQTAPDGSVWLGTGTGISHFSPPEDFATNFPAPPVFVAGFSQGTASPTLADATGFIRRGTNLTAHIGSLQFDRRSAMHIRYRMLPGQSSWTTTSSLDLALDKPSWGRHTLQVQAQLATGPWSAISEQILEVPWPFWLTWPAFLLYGASGGGIGFGTSRWRKRKQFEGNLPLPDLAAWRMRALSPETEDLMGTVIDGRYEIGHILSVGGFATVVRALDLQANGKLCAVKIFRYELGERAWIRHRFEQEIAALEQLSHPNIVRITGHGAVDTGAPYLVMEFIPGQSLREYLEGGTPSRNQVGSFLRQISSALQLLHQSMIYHRDLKPENLMVRSGPDGEQQIVLIDFSIAIVKSADHTFHGISRVAGTLDYMAPEQVIGYADASTDIYSLTKILLEMVTGLRWSDFLPEAKLDLPEQLRDYFAENPGIFEDDSIEQIVSALAFDPARRPRSVAEFASPIVRDLADTTSTTSAANEGG
jgi:tRNA A-37 threonylcarbamoyl transferase component Bud32